MIYCQSIWYAFSQHLHVVYFDPMHKIRECLSTHFIHKLYAISIRTPKRPQSTLFIRYSARYVRISVSKLGMGELRYPYFFLSRHQCFYSRTENLGVTTAFACRHLRLKQVCRCQARSPVIRVPRELTQPDQVIFSSRPNGRNARTVPAVPPPPPPHPQQKQMKQYKSVTLFIYWEGWHYFEQSFERRFYNCPLKFVNGQHGRTSPRFFPGGGGCLCRVYNHGPTITQFTSKLTSQPNELTSQKQTKRCPKKFPFLFRGGGGGV